VLRSRQRSQSIIEFGIIAILFTLIMFAIADFGLLLNDWLAVSSGARELARDAAVGMSAANINAEAANLRIPGVSADAYFTDGYCCKVGTPGSAIQLNVTYCTPDPMAPTICRDVPLNQLDSRFTSNGSPGTCTAWQSPPTVCPHPAAPNPLDAGDMVRLTLTAAGAQVITPLVRPFFSNSISCASTSARCYVALSSSLTMRFEGDTL
jgi:Flp pilus assembly protein TadG